MKNIPALILSTLFVSTIALAETSPTQELGNSIVSKARQNNEMVSQINQLDSQIKTLYGKISQNSPTINKQQLNTILSLPVGDCTVTEEFFAYSQIAVYKVQKGSKILWTAINLDDIKIHTQFNYSDEKVSLVSLNNRVIDYVDVIDVVYVVEKDQIMAASFSGYDILPGSKGSEAGNRVFIDCFP